MRGHLFVVRSDLLRLGADAWLLPTDAGLGVTRRWHAALPPHALTQLDRLRADPSARPPGWGRGTRTIPLERAAGERGALVLTDVGGTSATPAAWYAEGVHQFVAAVRELAANGRLGGVRTPPLAALPVVGTGKGGAALVKGEVLAELVDALLDEAERGGLDLVLVANDGPMFVAAQHARRQALARRGQDASWWGLDAALTAEAARIAAFARAGRLVLFLGAGVSRGAGLPGWDDLLAQLALAAGLSEPERAALNRLNALDRARILERRVAAQGGRLGDEVARLLRAERFSLGHGLLASLPVGEVVTTNYDELFERACAAAGRPAAVLPYQSVAGFDRWLLKLHGSVTHPDDIVLTREDYLRYADRRAALSGIVQALLITRHMLFAGFSLTDDNFHRIVDDVRKAIRGSDAGERGEPFGTALQLGADDLLAELWRQDLAIVATGGARELERFLDLALAEATEGGAPLLDPAYAGLLTEDEREIAAALRDLAANVSPAAQSSPAWRPVADLLARLGARAES